MTTLERLGRFGARHAGLVATVWLLAVIAAATLALGGMGGGSLFDRLTSGEPTVPGDNQTGRTLLDAQATTGPTVLVRLDGVDPASGQVRRAVTRWRDQTLGTPDVTVVRTPYTVPGGLGGEPGRALVGRDGRAVMAVVELDQDVPFRAQRQRADQLGQGLATSVRQLPGARVSTGSTAELVGEITDQVEVDLRTGEGVALPTSLLVMVLVFGGVVAAGLPLAGALASIAGGLASLWGFSRLLDLDATVVNVVTILGLGLCIDYGLLVVSRFREEIRRVVPASDGRPSTPTREQIEQAVGRTVALAGQTVLFSGLIVAISLSGLLFFPATVLRALGAAGTSVVLVAMLVALGFVPALLALSASRLLQPGVLSRAPGLRPLLARLGNIAPAEGVFSRLARRVQRFAWPVTLVVCALLLAVAAPALGAHLRSSSTDLLPVGSTQRSFSEDLDTRWPTLAGPDVTVVTRGSLAQVQAWSAQLTRLEGVEAVRPPQVEGVLVLLGVDVVGRDAGGRTATDVVHAVRQAAPAFPTWVTGQAAGAVDFQASLARALPWAAGVVVLATCCLLFLMTGSVLIPLKALVLNVLSLGASLGLVTWVFQGGHLEGVLSFSSAGAVETMIPPLVLAFGFGLAMDYEVFLLARIKERRDAGLSNDAAVAAGLQQSGRIITCAALLVVIVFAGLVAAKVLVVKQTGVALCLAVVLDATLVRMLLVPATMTLLGEWNWWAPRPLRRLHDRFSIGAH